jgi:hypothetical protein
MTVAVLFLKELVRECKDCFLQSSKEIVTQSLKKWKIIVNRHFFSKFLNTDYNLYPKIIQIL